MNPSFSTYSTRGLRDELGDRVELSAELARHVLKHVLHSIAAPEGSEQA